MTHIENIPHILENGITHRASINMNPDYVPIGDGTLIEKRDTFKLFNGKSLGDYLPFYFGVRMPMLYVIQNGFNGVASVKPSNIVYCVVSIKSVISEGLDFVFTDGHAVDGLTTFYNSDDIEKIDKIVDSNAAFSKYWRSETDLDLKRKKESEFLILGDVSPASIVGFITYSEQTKDIISHMEGFGSKKIYVRPNYYF